MNHRHMSLATLAERLGASIMGLEAAAANKNKTLTEHHNLLQDQKGFLFADIVIGISVEESQIASQFLNSDSCVLVRR